jgi:hypothetical protein
MKRLLAAGLVRSLLLTLTTKPTDLVTVLFEIECDIQKLDDNVIFADIIQFSEFLGQEEILFDLNATFRLENIQQDEQLYLIRMTAVNDG